MKDTKVMKKSELAKKMTPELKKQVCLKTGYSYSYIKKILNPTDTRYNQQVVDLCEKLIEAQEKTFNSINITVKRLKNKRK
jgi:hypothetical protein